MKTSKQFMMGSLFAVSVLASSLASAGNISVYSDQGGMPRCVQDSDSGAKVYLRYKGDHLQRTITAYKMRLGCKLWGAADKLPAKSGVVLNADTASAFGVQFPAKVIDAFNQSRMGATVFRGPNEASALDYIRTNQIKEYTQDLNVSLTQKYGFGFSAEVYRQMVQADPLNHKLLGEVMANYGKAKSGKIVPLSKLAEGVTILFAPGLGGSPDQPVDAKTGKIVARDQSDMMRIAEELQVEFGKSGTEQRVQILEMQPNGSIAGNREMIRYQLDKLLSEGRKIVIVGVCKGMAESVAALSVLHDKLENRGNGYGEIVGVMNLSGYLGGSRMSSFIAKMGVYGFLKWASALPKEKKLGPISNELLNILPETSQEHVQGMMKEAFPNLPKNAVYMNLVGILPGDGTGIVGSGKQLQDNIVRKGFEYAKTQYGANDGYIEYPGTVIPRSYGVQSDVLPLYSDHYIITGKLGNLDLTDKAIRLNFYRAIFSTLFDRMHAKGNL